MHAAPTAPITEQEDVPLDFARVAAAIRYLRAEAPRQPSLAEVAAQVHLSPAHFQRRFTAWAGLSPKQFARALSVDYAKQLLAGDDARASLFALSERAGYSSPSRLHDAFVHVEAMTPGEFRGGGAGATVRYAFAKTRFGESLIASTERGICSLAFFGGGVEVDRADRVDRAEAALRTLRERYPRAELRGSGVDALQARALDVVNGAAADPAKPLALHVRGTPFQHQVWRALLAVGGGAATTYGALGASIGKAGAARAIGSAVGANRVAWLIPCHRVLRSSGEFGGYAWGEERKAAMLAVEVGVG